MRQGAFFKKGRTRGAAKRTGKWVGFPSSTNNGLIEKENLERYWRGGKGGERKSGGKKRSGKKKGGRGR